METKHTPGPWKLGRKSKHGYYQYIGGDSWDEMIKVCVAIETIEETKLVSDEGIANAKLIAAAPELLASLLLAKKLIGNFRIKNEVPTQEVYEKIELAIKKATE